MTTQAAAPVIASPAPFDAGLHFLEALRPDPDHDMVEWCMAYRRIEEASARRGPWSPELVPYVVEPMRTITRSGTKRVVLIFGAQVGKTENIFLNCLCYYGVTQRDDIMVLLPTEKVIQKIKLRARPSLLAVDAIASQIAHVKKALKTDIWNLGRCNAIWANAASLADTVSSPIRLLLADEIELMAEEQLARAEKRLQGYEHRARAIYASTPGDEDGPAWQNYKATDQGLWFVRCDNCREPFAYEWENIRWEPREGSAARLGLSADPTRREFAYYVKGGSVDVWFVCSKCGHRYDQHARRILNASGGYVSQANRRQQSDFGFRVPALASPIYALRDGVASWYEAQGNSLKLVEFHNQVLALPHSPAIAVADEGAVLARIDQDMPRGAVPDWNQWLSLAIDVQGPCCKWSFWSWTLDRGHLVDHGLIQGEALSFLNGVPVLLFDRRLRTRGGDVVPVMMTMVDTSFESNNVYEWVRQQRARNKRIVPVMGRLAGKDMFSESEGKVSARSEVKILNINTNAVKSDLWNVFTATPGLTFHAETGQDFASEFVAEHRVRRAKSVGWAQYVWEKRPGHDLNDYFDCAVYARASFLFAGQTGQATPDSAPSLSPSTARRAPRPALPQRPSDPFGRR